MNKKEIRHPFRKMAGMGLAGLAIAGVVILLGVWFFVARGPMIGPGSQRSVEHAMPKGRWVAAHYLALPRYLLAVGTVSPIAPVNLAARISGRVVHVHLFSGEKVHTGEVLLRLNHTRLRAQVAASMAMTAMAQAQLKQALIDQRRDRVLLHSGDVTRAAMDLANTAVATGQAALANAIAREKTARTILGYTTILSPINGIVIRKFINVGDTVMPGEVLAEIYNPSRLQLDATVRQSLAEHLRLGEGLPIILAARRNPLMGIVREIVPHVSTRTRSFTVKIGAKFPAGIWPGMFGQARVPLGIHRTLVIPTIAITHIGQLAIVHAMMANGPAVATIQPGRHLGLWREVLAGVSAGQKVWIPARQLGNDRHHKSRANGADRSDAG